MGRILHKSVIVYLQINSPTMGFTFVMIQLFIKALLTGFN